MKLRTVERTKSQIQTLELEEILTKHTNDSFKEKVLFGIDTFAKVLCSSILVFIYVLNLGASFRSCRSSPLYSRILQQYAHKIIFNKFLCAKFQQLLCKESVNAHKCSILLCKKKGVKEMTKSFQLAMIFSFAAYIWNVNFKHFVTRVQMKHISNSDSFCTIAAIFNTYLRTITFGIICLFFKCAWD